MPKRYELTDAQWNKIEDLLPGKPGDRGRTARDNRTFVNGVCRALSPLFWTHINPYGRFVLDMDSRLDLAAGEDAEVEVSEDTCSLYVRPIGGVAMTEKHGRGGPPRKHEPHRYGPEGTAHPPAGSS